jgi:hypothetical protein
MNTHVRDNFNTLMHLAARKSVDESITSSITPQNDDVLLQALAVNEVLQFELNLLITGGAGNFLGSFTYPSGSIAGTVICLAAGSTLTRWDIGSSTSPSAGFESRTNSTTIPTFVTATGVMTNGGTAGNLQFQWAQNSSSATATIVKANSTLWVMKLA